MEGILFAILVIDPLWIPRGWYGALFISTFMVIQIRSAVFPRAMCFPTNNSTCRNIDHSDICILVAEHYLINFTGTFWLPGDGFWTFWCSGDRQGVFSPPFIVCVQSSHHRFTRVHQATWYIPSAQWGVNYLFSTVILLHSTPIEGGDTSILCNMWAAQCQVPKDKAGVDQHSKHWHHRSLSKRRTRTHDCSVMKPGLSKS